MIEKDRPDLLERALARPAVGALADRLGADFTPQVLLVGGGVRDLLTGGPLVDLDLLVGGPLQPLIDRLGGRLRSHQRFATATLELEGVRCDIAEARRETYAHPGALPDVAPASVEEDLARRDFTINAIALGLTGASRGRLLSVQAALEDLEARILRVLHAQSFEDDPTRLLRLARYSARLAFEIEPDTLRLCERAIRGGALATVSGPRIGNELRLLAREADPVGAFEALHALGIDAAIAPGFGVGDASAPTAARAIGLLPPGGRPDLIVLAMAVAGMDRTGRSELLDHLGFNAEDRERIVAICERAESVAAGLKQAGRPSEVAHAARGAGVELLAVAGALGPEKPAREWIERLRHIRLQIDGGDLLEAGVPSGPLIGVGLAAARDALLDGRAESRDAQLAEAVRAAGAKG